MSGAKDMHLQRQRLRSGGGLGVPPESILLLMPTLASLSRCDALLQCTDAGLGLPQRRLRGGKLRLEVRLYILYTTLCT